MRKAPGIPRLSNIRALALLLTIAVVGCGGSRTEATQEPSVSPPAPTSTATLVSTVTPALSIPTNTPPPTGSPAEFEFTFETDAEG